MTPVTSVMAVSAVLVMVSVLERVPGLQFAPRGPSGRSWRPMVRGTWWRLGASLMTTFVFQPVLFRELAVQGCVQSVARLSVGRAPGSSGGGQARWPSWCMSGSTARRPCGQSTRCILEPETLDAMAATRAHARAHDAQPARPGGLIFLEYTAEGHGIRAIGVRPRSPGRPQQSADRQPVGRAGVHHAPAHRLRHVPASSQQNFGIVFTMWDRLSGRLLVQGRGTGGTRAGVPGGSTSTPSSSWPPSGNRSGRRAAGGRSPGGIVTIDQAERVPAMPMWPSSNGPGCPDRGASRRRRAIEPAASGRRSGWVAGGDGGGAGRRRYRQLAAEAVLPALQRSTDPGRAGGGGRHRCRGCAVDAPCLRAPGSGRCRAQLLHGRCRGGRAFREAVDLFGQEPAVELLRVAGVGDGACRRCGDQHVRHHRRGGFACRRRCAGRDHTTSSPCRAGFRRCSRRSSVTSWYVWRPNRTGTPTDFEVAGRRSGSSIWSASRRSRSS